MGAPTLFLIDGSSQMYRAYHAFRGKGLSNQDGHSTHAVYVFVTMLRKLIADHAPTHIAASFDLAGPTFRDELAADYKANRAAMPDDLAEQIAWVHEACEALGVPILTAPGFEADDVIGTTALRAATAGFQVAIVSIDKDFFQLVGGAVRVYDPREDGTWFDDRGVLEKFGVTPAQVVDVLALVGDTSDNVAGVPGIGKKGAVDLVTRYGSLDAVFERSAELKPRQQEALVTHRSAALQSRQLVTIRTDVPITVDFESLRYRGPSRERCYDLFSRLSFQFASEYAETGGRDLDYTLVCSLEALDALVSELRRSERPAFCLLVDGGAAMTADVIGMAFSTADRRASYVPFAAGTAANDLLTDRPPLIDAREAFLRTAAFFEDEAVAKAAHDVKFAAVVLGRFGVALRGAISDPMLASYVLDATRLGGHGLDSTALGYLGYKAQTIEDVRGRGVKAGPLGLVAPETMLTFAGERGDLARQLSLLLESKLSAAGLDRVYRSIELPLVPVLAAVERHGVRVDLDALRAQSRHIEQELAVRSARIFELAGGEFNINSPRQLAEVLFDRLKLPALRKTGKTRSASTAGDVLEELALTHELPRLILDWRGLQKLKGTYVDALPLLVHPETGRVHTCFNQAVAATGRLSSSDPNLQNIPIRTELGRQIRRAFVAAPGHVLISADYSQIELRVLAHLAADEALIEAFQSGQDIHDRTAAKVFGEASGLSVHELRRRAKIINYALLYGKTAFTLAKDIGVPQDAAQQFIDAYFAGFPRVRAFIDDTLKRARETGVVQTLFGRRRFVPALKSSNWQERSATERETVNMPVQGTAADILKLAMIDVHGQLAAKAAGTRMILTVHDELLFESPREEAEEAAALVRERMEQAVQLAVPLTVDVGVADNWNDAKP